MKKAVLHELYLSFSVLHSLLYCNTIGFCQYSGCQMKILGATQKNSPHKMFLHKCVLQYVRTLKLNDATLASLEKLKYSRWRPRWPPKNKILNTCIFLSMWARHIIFVATHRFLRFRNRLSMLKFISDVSVTCTQNGRQNGHQSMKSPKSSLIYGLD